MSLTLIHTERFAEHQTPPGHPERPERAEVMDVVAGRWKSRGVEVVPPSAATREQLLRVHDGDYLRRISETVGRAVKLDPDTYTSPESHEIALLAAGAAVQAVNHAMSGPQRRALAFVRPPGHHAERDRAMGFCLFNNVGVAARYAQSRHKEIERVAIIDWDVHHGNGTQGIFYEDQSVFYFSMHQYPWYPGTGTRSETGHGRGRGYTLNLPLRAMTPTGEQRRSFDTAISEIASQFTPDLIIISAGFDAHKEDPLGQLLLTDEDFVQMTKVLKQWAAEACGGRIVSCMEGGYNLETLGETVRTHVNALRNE